jgi:hypothetical protein
MSICIYHRLIWTHSFPDDPIEIWSEIGGNRAEIRKLELFRDGRTGYANLITSSGGSQLCDQKMLLSGEVEKDADLELLEITKQQFEEMWAEKVGSSPR